MSLEQQVALLCDRGLHVPDPCAAIECLRHINYYRLSGYCLAFESRRHVFATGTTLDQVLALVEFDRVLRDLVTDALETVEVDLRAAVAYHFGERYGPFGHTRPEHFVPHFEHGHWLSSRREEAERAREDFVRHYRHTYTQYPDLPVWMAAEVMSFGALSRMYSGMLRTDQKRVAYRYGQQPAWFGSWLHHLVYVRNICAHHARLWDRNWAVKPSLPAGKVWRPPHLMGNDRLLVTLLILRALLRRCPAAASATRAWQGRVEEHLLRLPVATAAPRMGLASGWMDHPVWSAP